MANRQLGSQRSEIAKVVIVGGRQVGKRSILERYCSTGRDPHIAERARFTAFVQRRNVTVGDRTLCLEIWDTAVEERFCQYTSPPSVGAAVVIYDITRKSSFNNLPLLMRNLQNRVHECSIYAIVGNKCDLPDNREVSYEDGERFARDHGAIFVETSARTGTNVNSLFDQIGQQLVERILAPFEEAEIQLDLHEPGVEPEARRRNCCRCCIL